MFWNFALINKRSDTFPIINNGTFFETVLLNEKILAALGLDISTAWFFLIFIFFLFVTILLNESICDGTPINDNSWRSFLASRLGRVIKIIFKDI